MSVKRARYYDLLAFLVVVLVVGLDHWTKALVVQHIPLYGVVPLPVVGHYLVLYYIQNNGAAFSMFAQGSGPIILSILILAAIVVVGYLYVRMLNTGPLLYKLIFGLILGGALGNLVDRAIHGGYVVDFISFRIPALHYYFAVFNIADACISVGVVLLLLFVLFGGLSHTAEDGDQQQQQQQQDIAERQQAATFEEQSDSVHATENNG
ncbi:MAG TPA: signal peptidase II [Dictyobacter sp.]|nr:signal peptidase II [Dictyobacter sp.]